MIVRAKIVDAGQFARYRKAVMPLIETFGGKHVRAGSVELLEGEEEGRSIALFEFPCMDAIRAFWNSPEYVPIKELRRGAATLEIWGLPVA